MMQWVLAATTILLASCEKDNPVIDNPLNDAYN